MTDKLEGARVLLGGPHAVSRHKLASSSKKKVELASVFPISGRQDVIYLGNPTIMKILEKSNRSSPEAPHLKQDHI